MYSVNKPIELIGVFTIGPLGPCPPPLNCEKSHVWPKMQPWRSCPDGKSLKLKLLPCQMSDFETKMHQIRFGEGRKGEEKGGDG